MVNAENGIVTIPLLTPVCVHSALAARRMCLEATLGGQLYERSGDGPGALAEVRSRYLDQWVVDEHTAIPTASQIIFKGPIKSRNEIPFTRSIFRVISDPDLRANIAGTNWNNAIQTLQLPYKSEMRPPSYEAIGVDTVYYLFRGDIGLIERAFRRASRIGALRAKGGGEIDRGGVYAETVPNQSPLFGIIAGNRLMRPIPARCKQALAKVAKVEYQSGMIEGWQAPFHWSENKELCLVPSQVGPEMVMSMSELARVVMT